MECNLKEVIAHLRSCCHWFGVETINLHYSQHLPLSTITDVQ